jgi:Xaa-Pro aminopeptidase
MSALARARAVVPALRELVAESGAAGFVLTTPGAVAWATGGANPPVDRTAPVDPSWVVVPADPAAEVRLVTTVVEAPRLRAEGPFDELGWPIVEVGWSEAAEFVRAAEAILGRPAAALAADGYYAFGHDAADVVIARRMALTPPEQEDLRALAHDATVAVEDALRAWRPGDSDRTVAAAIAARAEASGATAPVLLVGGDDRLSRFRHPVASGQPINDAVMAVLVAERGGLHVALTRYAARPSAIERLQPGLAAVRAIHCAVLDRCRPGVSAAELLGTLDEAYGTAGHAGAWREHYQGGPIGYAQREFELAPDQNDSAWWKFQLPENCAIAWNPSVRGGAKDEDTYLLGADGVEWLTASNDWPRVRCGRFERPAVLPVDSEGIIDES